MNKPFRKIRAFSFKLLRIRNPESFLKLGAEMDSDADEDVKVKQELLQELVLEELRKHAKGLGTDALALSLDLSQHQLLEVLNSLSNSQSIDFLTYANGSTGVKARDAAVIDKLRTLSASDAQVYTLILTTGNTGCWVKDIKLKSGLHQKEVNAAIKNLERLGWIKAVKNVKAPTKKIYMVSELEPSSEVTGGAWLQLFASVLTLQQVH
jgi:DNA-directed RNA polymerase III subunit RPC6